MNVWHAISDSLEFISEVIFPFCGRLERVQESSRRSRRRCKCEEAGAESLVGSLKDAHPVFVGGPRDPTPTHFQVVGLEAAALWWEFSTKFHFFLPQPSHRRIFQRILFLGMTVHGLISDQGTSFFSHEISKTWLNDAARWLQTSLL